MYSRIDNNTLYYIRHGHGIATGRMTGEGRKFVILTGSRIWGAYVDIDSRVNARRRLCEDRGIIFNMELTADITFKSPAEAAEFVTGHDRPGSTVWKTENGACLRTTAPKMTNHITKEIKEESESIKFTDTYSIYELGKYEGEKSLVFIADAVDISIESAFSQLKCWVHDSMADFDIYNEKKHKIKCGKAYKKNIGYCDIIVCNGTLETKSGTVLRSSVHIVAPTMTREQFKKLNNAFCKKSVA